MLNSKIYPKQIIVSNKASLVFILLAILVLWFYVLRVPTYDGFDTFEDVLALGIGVPTFFGGSLLVFMLVKAILDALFGKETNGFLAALPIVFCLLSWGLFFTDEGYARRAIITRDPSFCDKIGDYHRDECYMTMAKINMEDGERLCGMISDHGFYLRNNCYIMAAKNLNDSGLCKKIVEYEVMMEECAANFLE
jgi:hypothetical protein